MILERLQLDPDVTIGALSIDGDFECWIVEDRVREVAGQPVSAWKVPGQSAIPRGTYKVTITPSNRFKRDLPLLLNVPGFDGIRIHPGNTAADTEGCLLPGSGTDHTLHVFNSRIAFEVLFNKLEAASERGEDVWITIV